MLFEIIPYTGLDVFSFSMTREDARRVLGEPDRTIKRSGRKIIQESWHRLGIYLIFGETGLNEINIRPPIYKSDTQEKISFFYLHYDIFEMDPKYIYSELCRLDGGGIKEERTTLFPNLGIGISGFYEYSLDEQDERSFGIYKKNLLEEHINRKC